MPIYEFECGWGHRIEKIFSIKDCPKSIICECCINSAGVLITGIGGSKDNGRAYKVFSMPAKTVVTPPTDYFKNPKTGEVRTANHSNQRPPIGFIKEEARNLQERLKLEKRLNFDQSIENEIKSDTLNEAQERSRKARHEELRSQMGDMDTHSQLLVKKAMERTNKKKIKRKKSEVRIVVNHMDSSNIDK